MHSAVQSHSFTLKPAQNHSKSVNSFSYEINKHKDKIRSLT